MNVILELPATVPKSEVWTLTAQIRQIKAVRSANIDGGAFQGDSSAITEIWIELNDNAPVSTHKTKAIETIAMLTRDIVQSGAKMALKDCVLVI